MINTLIILILFFFFKLIILILLSMIVCLIYFQMFSMNIFNYPKSLTSHDGMRANWLFNGFRVDYNQILQIINLKLECFIKNIFNLPRKYSCSACIRTRSYYPLFYEVLVLSTHVTFFLLLYYCIN